jgi:hypothetical protein
MRFFTNGSERMRINSSGNLGIGTSSPDGKLQLVPTAVDTPIFSIRRQDSSSTNLFEFFQDSNMTGGTGGAHLTTNNRPFAISTDSSSTLGTGLFIDISGNVGMGTSSPDGILHLDGGTNTKLVLEKDGSGYASLTFHNDGASTSYIQLDGSENMVHYGGSGVNQIFYSGGSERMRITDAGRVGIGESSPDNTLHVNSTSSTVTKFERDSGSNGSLTIGFPSTRTNLEASGDMRLTATRVLINKSSPGSLTNAEVIVDHDGSSTYGIRLNSSSTSGTQYHQSFDRGESQAGYITSNSATTIAFNNASDERLKENIQNSGSAIQDIKDIKVRQFDWKDGIDTHRDFGFVAQELVNIVPEAVSQGTDELNDNGKPIRSWGVDYSHIVPRLVKVCQEQQTKIEELEAEVTALKNQP